MGRLGDVREVPLEQFGSGRVQRMSPRAQLPLRCGCYAPAEHACCWVAVVIAAIDEQTDFVCEVDQGGGGRSVGVWHRDSGA